MDMNKEFWLVRVDKQKRIVYLSAINPWHIDGHFVLAPGSKFRKRSDYSGEPSSALVEIPISDPHYPR